MKLIEPYCEIIPQEPGLQGIYKQIEIAGRTCYKSEDKMTESSAEDFVNRMIKSGHGAMLEHGTVYLRFSICCDIPTEIDKKESDIIRTYYKNPYSRVIWFPISSAYDGYLVITNYRVLVENNWLDHLKYIFDLNNIDEKYYAPLVIPNKRITVRFVTSIGITRELVRHRVFSFANESTRYCNYSKKRFGGELTFIKPYWMQDSDAPDTVAFISSLEQSEKAYNKLTEMGVPAQAAREVLPLATKSEIIMTGFKSDWDRFLDIRLHQSTGPVHPDMLVIANMIDKQLQ